jgi:hypothetical protein
MGIVENLKTVMGKPVIGKFKKLMGIGFSTAENPPPPPEWDASVVDENKFNGNLMLRSSTDGEFGDDGRNGSELRPRSVNDLPPLDQSSVRRVGEVSGREVSGKIFRRRFLSQQRRFVGRSVLSPLMNSPQSGQDFSTLQSSSLLFPETGMSQSMKGSDRTPLNPIFEGSRSSKETGWGTGRSLLLPEEVSQREGYIDTGRSNNRGHRSDNEYSNEDDDDGENSKGEGHRDRNQFQTMDSVWSHDTNEMDIDEERVMR